MNIPSIPNQNFLSNDPASNAVAGIQQQSDRLERNIAEITESETSSSGDSQSRDQALVEQLDIVNSFKANARSFEAANQLVGTIIDIKI